MSRDVRDSKTWAMIESLDAVLKHPGAETMRAVVDWAGKNLWWGRANVHALALRCVDELYREG